MPAYSRGNLLGTAGQPEDKVSRPRKLWLRCERYFVTDSGGMHTFKTVDLFDNQQIMKTSMQRLKTLPVTVVAADTSDLHADAVTKTISVSKAAADDNTQAEVPAAGDAQFRAAVLSGQ
jgi:hypothetical protein